MNLYIESLAEYLTEHAESVLGSTTLTKEARFIVQSLAPGEVFQLFSKLDEFRLAQEQKQNIKSYFRVATKLWEEWLKHETSHSLDTQLQELGGLSSDGQRLWIDEEDKLTWYRNRTVSDEAEGADALLIVLVGLNHATDQGGLSDFHKVDDQNLWQEMGKTFMPWLDKINFKLDMNAGESELSKLDEVLFQLHDIKRMPLNRVAHFLHKLVHDMGSACSFSEFNDQLLSSLPFWGLPPLASEKKLTGKNLTGAIKDADAFISHKNYKSEAQQKKDWERIEKELGQPDSDLSILANEHEGYADNLKDFIFKADKTAQQVLRNINALPLIAALKRKETKGRQPSEKIATFTGMSFECLLHGLWRACAEFDTTQLEDLDSIHIAVTHFDHDLLDNKETGEEKHLAAKQLLQGCFGGIEHLFNSIDFKLPIDQEQQVLPRRLWEKSISLDAAFDFDTVAYKVSRTRPRACIKVSFLDSESKELHKYLFFWRLDATHSERVRFEAANAVWQQWHCSASQQRLLPSFNIPTPAMAAVYHAADEEEANRLISNALTNLQLNNLLEGLSFNNVDPQLWSLLEKVVGLYRNWLKTYIEQGYYFAAYGNINLVASFINAYSELAEAILDTSKIGAPELLRRIYKSFMIIDSTSSANDAYVSSAIAWGLSPCLLELLGDQERFLAEGFPEITANLLLQKANNRDFERLVSLAKIHRPLAGLITNQQGNLSAEIRSFGLIHFLGKKPSTVDSLAVQALLREEDEDSEEISDIIYPCEESYLVADALRKYQKIYPFAQDGLRIMAANIKELPTILAGVDAFLKDYLAKCPESWEAFQCTVMVYSAASPLSMEYRLGLWCEHLMERHREKGRKVNIKVGHRFTLLEAMEQTIKEEQRLYDVAFLFNFLSDHLHGKIDPAEPFEFSFSSRNAMPFPMADYPRPIKGGESQHRQSLTSNRRLQVQTHHANMSARLAYGGNDTKRSHVIYAQVDYQPWTTIVESLHQKAQWVACIDPFVDKRLLAQPGLTDPDTRKVIGFSSGLGAYGELNITISSEQDTLKQLTDKVAEHLVRLMPHEESEHFSSMAARIVKESEEVIGLASLHAVVGDGEKIREVIGFSAILRALPKPDGQVTQLIPLDSMQHWFTNKEQSGMRPDLIQLSLEFRDDDIPLIHAHVIECKFAKKREGHVEKAGEQLHQGLYDLTGLFLPQREDSTGYQFDRRYWWAQLHRAISSRAVVNLPETDWRKLDLALEKLAEGDFEIRWQGSIYTFWTNEALPTPVVNQIAMMPGTVQNAYTVDDEFQLQHIELGYQGISSLFAKPEASDVTPITTPMDAFISARPLANDTTDPYSWYSQEHSEYEHRDDLGQSEIEEAEEIAIQQHDIEQHAVEQPANSTEQVDEIVNDTQEETATSPAQIIDSVTEPTATEPEPETSIVSQIEAKQPDDSIVVASAQTTEIKVPETILLGTRNNGEPVHWHYGHPKLANRHLLIFGTSGSGKTYGIQCFLAELAKQHIRSLIIDYTDGFLPQQVEQAFSTIAKPKNHFIVTEKLPLNPFRRQEEIIDPSLPAIVEDAFRVAARISSTFKAVFPTMGDQQFATLRRIIEEGVDRSSAFSLEDMLSGLLEEGGNGETLANKLEPLVKARPFKQESDSAWQNMLQSPDNRVHILQLKGLAREIQKMVTEFTLWDLWDYAQSNGNKNRPIPMVLDEIQNLDHSSDSPIDKMLREGRKFGLSMILATQTTSQFTQEQRDRLFQAGHKLFFKPATTEVDRFAQILSQATDVSKNDWVQRLSRLEKGQCWSLGPILKSDGSLKEEAVLVNITSLENRQSGVES